MNFSSSRPRRAPVESIVPMINVVFLLLIFFLMSAQIAPPDPFDVTPPGSDAREAPDPDTLYISANGQLSYNGVLGDAAFEALNLRNQDIPLSVRADASLPASQLAGLLRKLGSAGVRETALVTGVR